MFLNRRVLLAGVAGMAFRKPSTGEEHLSSSHEVFELRQYTLRGGQRDALISIFEEHFIEPQVALGAAVVGMFCDLDDPDRFVWIRGFHDMSTRRQALEGFYGGPIWHTYGSAANATMIDSANVLLLRPICTGQSFAELPAKNVPGGMFGADIYYLDAAPLIQFSQFFDRILAPVISAAGGQLVARLTTEEAHNDSRLPVREHDRTYVCITRWAHPEMHEKFVRHYASLSGWRDSAPEAILPALMRKPERLRLSPTWRSLLQ
ncbi:MAG TPA: NIPSNAP family protein [Steroidobacteraceae bacterium]